MTISEAVSKRIDELLFKRGWTLYKLSKESLIPISTLKNLYNNHTKCPSLAIIYKLADAFQISYLEFLDCEILKSEELEYL
mgnify:CR=1 FL=1